MSRQITNAKRCLDTVYRHNGVTVTVTPAGGTPFDQLAILRISDMEEGPEGSKIETIMTGFHIHLRSYLIPEGVTLTTGDIVTLSDPFDGHSVFHIDAPRRVKGSNALQYVFALSPHSEAASTEQGYNFSD